MARQNDGSLAPFPVWDDIRTFDGRPWRGRVDVVSGGFPCQDVSVANTARTRGEGVANGERSGLWREVSRVVREVRPHHVLVENSPALTSRGLGIVLGDLASMGYDAWWGVLSAADVGAPHLRKRIWIAASNPDRPVANTNGQGQLQQEGPQPSKRGRAGDGSQPGSLAGAVRNAAERLGEEPQQSAERRQAGLHDRASSGGIRGDWPPAPRVGRVADGVAKRMDRLKSLGNGQVPRVAAAAWQALTPG